MNHATLERLGGQNELRPAGSFVISRPDDLLVDRSIRGAYDSRGNFVEETTRQHGFGEWVPDYPPVTLVRNLLKLGHEDEAPGMARKALEIEKKRH